MIDTNEKMSPGDLEALLPWHAAGTLNSRDADRVEKALATDRELARRYELVREELTETILLNESLGAPSARVMSNLFKAIDNERKIARQPATSHKFGAWLADLFTPRAMAWSASAAAVIILLQAGVIARMALQEQGGQLFETASDHNTGTTRGVDIASYALVRFAPKATMGDITRFLDSRSATIVDGPKPGGPGGMYRVRVALTYLSKDDLDRLVREMQAASNIVSFAAPTE